MFEYDTPKFVHIKNKKIGVLNRLIQIGIIIFMVGWVVAVHVLSSVQRTGLSCMFEETGASPALFYCVMRLYTMIPDTKSVMVDK